MTNRWMISGGFPLGSVRRDLDRTFNGYEWPWWTVRQRTRARSFPAVNLWETDEAIYAEAEVPGLRFEDIELLVKGNELTLKGERKSETQEGVTYHRRERAHGAFSGVIQLPVEIDTDAVEANLVNGVLTITMPKAASVRPRKIEVKALSA